MSTILVTVSDTVRAPTLAVERPLIPGVSILNPAPPRLVSERQTALCYIHAHERWPACDRRALGSSYRCRTGSRR